MTTTINTTQNNYRIVPVSTGFQIMRITGQYPSLERIEMLQAREQSWIKTRREVKRPEGYWEDQKAHAGELKLQPLEVFPSQKEAEQALKLILKEEERDFRKSAKQHERHEKSLQKYYEKKREKEQAQHQKEHDAWRIQQYHKRLAEQAEQQERIDTPYYSYKQIKPVTHMQVSDNPPLSWCFDSNFVFPAEKEGYRPIQGTLTRQEFIVEEGGRQYFGNRYVLDLPDQQVIYKITHYSNSETGMQKTVIKKENDNDND